MSPRKSIRVEYVLKTSLCFLAITGLAIAELADEPPRRTGGTGEVIGYGRARTWAYDELEWQRFSPALSDTTGSGGSYANVGGPTSRQAIIRWPAGARASGRSSLKATIIVLAGTLSLEARSSHKLQALSFAGIADGDFNLSCEQGDCVFYASLLYTNLLASASASGGGGRLGPSHPARVFPLDFSKTQWTPLPRLRDVEVGKLFDPSGLGGWWRVHLSLDVAALQQWRGGLIVTQADRLILGSGLVLSGKLGLAIADSPPQDLIVGSYLELPKTARYTAECRSESCMVLASYY